MHGMTGEATQTSPTATYGKTLDQAVEAMLDELEHRNRCRRLRIVEREYAGIVCA